ncbi:MAG: hypothetical protein AAGG09_02655 [Pseudomonadota bacterium]
MRLPLAHSLLSLLLAAGVASAEPYCAALQEEQTIAKTYRQIAPIYSDAERGWIFANDQLREDYALKDSAVHLLERIVEEIRARGMELAIVIPPPRPLVAGPDTRRGVLPPEAGYDAVRAALSFQRMMRQIAETGAVAPNLLDAALAAETAGTPFYFQRDTHWTPSGAVRSAAALAEALEQASVPWITPAADAPAPATDPFVEPGSLAEVAREVCGIEIGPETTAAVRFPRPADAVGLLGDTPSDTARAALVGTSFSDRYKRDALRVADAIAHATGMDVDNVSVSGGGALSAFEAYVLSGEIDAARHKLLIWEVPYTSAFKSVSGLRQILGALQAGKGGADLAPVALPDADVARLALPAGLDPDTSVFGVRLERPGKARVKGVLHFDNGSRMKISLARSAHMPARAQSAPMYLSLAAAGTRRPVAIELSYDAAQMAGATVLLPRRP